MPGQTYRKFFALVCLALAATALPAVVARDGSAPYADREFSLGELYIRTTLTQATQLADGLAGGALAELGVPPNHAYRDNLTGRWANLIITRPMIPGDGVGNRLTWESLGRSAPVDEAGMRHAAITAFRSFLADHAGALGISMDNLGDAYVQIEGQLIQIAIPRVLDGVPVEGAFINASISHGNLILMGLSNWGDAELRTDPALAREGAIAAVRDHLSGIDIESFRGEPELRIVPVDRGEALDHRLVWSVRPVLADSLGGWEGLVDAHSGELVAFRDTNHYADMRKVIGGVYPTSNDGVGEDGTEQPGWPMPWADVSTSLGDFFTDAGGNLAAPVDGPVTTTLDGLYILIDDTCGNVSESNANQHVDLRQSGGDDCTVPSGASAGNTHSARSGFYELNRIAEWARTRTSISWLSDQLEANMNINSFCNAFWGFDNTVNFYRSGGGCANTGEIAGVFDHEWGHGLDDFDNRPGISNPGEGIADVYAALRLNDSCIGRGFWDSQLCTGYGDPCTECDGIRDVDFLKRESGQPHDVNWSNSNCGFTSHCKGAVYAEAVWDLTKRDLPNLYGVDSNRALEISTRLTLLGATNVGNWFTETGDDEDGCASESGYQNYLAADDDNGTLADGTPHMQAIFNAFNRHGIACSTPAVQDSGCAGTPETAPVVTASPLDRGAMLSWTAVAGASSYGIYRTEGVHQCDRGKTLVAETTSLNFTDANMLNNFEYYYSIAAMGPDAACIGAMSDCTTVTPEATPPTVSVSGSCPGNVTIDVSGAAPNGPVGIIRGEPGSSELSMGQCTGMPIDLTNTTLSTVLTADANGNASLTGNAGANVCGASIVAADGINCAASNVDQIP